MSLANVGIFDGGGDIHQMQATMQAIELACSYIRVNINLTAAEATIMSLHHAPQPYRTCHFILESSQVPDARFQAAAAIRDAAIREWTSLSIDNRKSLISYCLDYAMKHANSLEGYVRAKISSVAAQLMKRGWIEFNDADKEAFLLQVNQSIIGFHGVDAQFVGINFLESLVSEFSPGTSGAMGLPAEYHDQCRRSLERDFLKIFYSWVNDGASRMASKIAGTHGGIPEARACTAAFRFMFQVLNWEFQYGDTGSKTAGGKGSQSTMVQPGHTWREILISSGHSMWLVNFYTTLRQQFSVDGYWMDCPLAVSARNLIVQLCCLYGNIFENEDMHYHHLKQLFSGIILWMDPPDVVTQSIESGRSESELVDGCRALLSIATMTNPISFELLLKSFRSYGTFTLLSTLMYNVIKVLISKMGDEDTWCWEVRDILLDTWTTLFMCKGTSLPFPLEATNAAATVFAMIVESELTMASIEMDEESDCHQPYSVSAMDERLISYALIARVVVNESIPFLHRVFTERLTRLHQTEGIASTSVLEEIYSLLLIAGHVLADEGIGETPLVPDSIQTNFVEADNDPVTMLSCSIIKFSEQSLDPSIRAHVFSPRVLEAVVWFLGRWAPTYMFSGEKDYDLNPESAVENRQHSLGSKKCLLTYFGENGQGKAVLDIIVRVSIMTLLNYQGETDLQTLTCTHLLHSLVKRKNICAHLVTLDSWHELANTFVNTSQLLQVSGANQRSLAQSLVLSAYGVTNLDSSNQYVRQLVSHMVKYLTELSQKTDLRTIAQQPDIILSVSCMLERLRGASSASEVRTQKALYEMGVSLMLPTLTLLEVYKHESAVIYLLLQFVVEWVDGQISYLEPDDTSSVIGFSMRLLQLYSSNNIGKISVSMSNALLSESKSEMYKDLRALLKLLSSLGSKDLIDLASESIESHGTNISEVVYFGLQIVTPSISLELLKFPKLCGDYFSLLSHMLEVYPETVTRLPSTAFLHLLSTLDYGLHHQDPEIVNLCFRALSALAAYHYKELIAGKNGLTFHTAAANQIDNMEGGILCKFLHVLLHILLFEDYSPDLIGPAADALLPLILCEQHLFQKLANQLIEKQTNEAFRSRLVTSFQALMNIPEKLDRPNYKIFRKNLSGFLMEVRGFLRTI